jgi:hypothetical protein
MVVLLFCMSVSLQNGYSQFIEHQVNHFSPVSDPEMVFMFDMDGDGDNDVLTFSADDGIIFWFENNGGAFIIAQHVVADDAQNIKGVYAADMDNDGDLDVLAASESDAYVRWYENIDGAGDFGAGNVIASHSLQYVRAADIDGDGDLDVFGTSKENGEVRIFNNTGNAVFEDGQFMSAVDPVTPRMVDMDQDEDLDLVYA